MIIFLSINDCLSTPKVGNVPLSKSRIDSTRTSNRNYGTARISRSVCNSHSRYSPCAMVSISSLPAGLWNRHSLHQGHTGAVGLSSILWPSQGVRERSCIQTTGVGCEEPMACLPSQVWQPADANTQYLRLGTAFHRQERERNNRSATILYFPSDLKQDTRYAHGLVIESWKLNTDVVGGTIGTSPWDQSCKKRRTAVGAIMTRPAIQKSAPMLDLEISATVKDLGAVAFASANGLESIEVDPRIYFQRMALNTTLMMCYSTRIEDIKDPILHELLSLASSIST